MPRGPFALGAFWWAQKALEKIFLRDLEKKIALPRISRQNGPFVKIKRKEAGKK